MKTLLLVAFLLAGETVVPKTADPTPYIDESCQESVACNGETVIWELIMVPSGEVVSFGDMEQGECEEMKALVEEQTDMEAFTGLKCRPRWVEREKI